MKKSVLIVTILLLLSLVATTTVSAEVDHKLPKWEQVFDPVPHMGENVTSWSGVEFKGKLYFVYWFTDSIDQVWGSRDGENWSLAWDASSIQEGFELIGEMAVFKGQMYTSLFDWDGEYPPQIVRTRNGQHWEPVAWAELGADEYGTFFGPFTTFQGAIYIAKSYWDQTINKVTLLRSTSGDPGTWEEVAQLPDWGEVASYAVFKGALYIESATISIFNPSTLEGELQPTQIWRSYDGVGWEPVNTNGLGDPMNNTGGGLAEYKGYLYAGTGNQDEPWSGGDIYRSRDGMNWEPVTTDGFDNPANIIMGGFATYKGMLFAYSGNWEGTEVYASKDGVHWVLTNEAGWGDSRNRGVNREHAQIVFKGSLYLGVVGPAGVMRYTKP